MSFARAKRFSYSEDQTKSPPEHRDCRRCSLRRSRKGKRSDTCLNITKTINTSNSSLPTRRTQSAKQRSISDQNLFDLVKAGPSGFIDDDFSSYASYSPVECDEHYFEFKNLSRDIERLCSLDSLETEQFDGTRKKTREIDVQRSPDPADEEFAKSMSFIESMVNKKVEEELTKHTVSKWRRKIYRHAEMMASTIIDDFTSILSFRKKSK